MVEEGACPLGFTRDPTENVVSIVDAAVKRQDDLREKETRHIFDIADLRETYGEKLRVAESDRIDAIRAVDVGAAAILANQVTASAEALRVQVEAARQQTAVGLDAALQPIKKDIADLRQVQYEQAGAKAGGTEQRELSTNARAVIFSVLGILATIAIIISPHIK
jgi:hypothetical protein